MNEEKVKAVALRFLAERVAEHERIHGLSRFQYSLHSIRRPTDLHPQKWAVVFLVTGLAGDPVDGPTIIHVDDKSGEAEFP
jgi:hypothetical protein